MCGIVVRLNCKDANCPPKKDVCGLCGVRQSSTSDIYKIFNTDDRRSPRLTGDHARGQVRIENRTRSEQWLSDLVSGASRFYPSSASAPQVGGPVRLRVLSIAETILRRLRLQCNAQRSFSGSCNGCRGKWSDRDGRSSSCSVDLRAVKPQRRQPPAVCGSTFNRATR